MRTIYLHIGMHKTGSTSIQKYFRGYDDGSTKYPELGFENHSIPFYTAFSGDHQNYLEWQTQGLSSEEIEKKKLECFQIIESSLKGDREKNLIFSGEDISVIPAEGIKELKELLEAYSDKVLVVAYIRDPLTFAVSALQEKIKTGVNVKALEIANYEFRFDKFTKIFGKNNTYFKQYDTIILENLDVIGDFSNLLNIKLKNRPVFENKSFSTNAIKIIYVLNKIIGYSNEEKSIYCAKKRCINQIETLFPGKFEIPKEIAKGALSRKDVDWLRKNEIMVELDFSYYCSDDFEEGALEKYLEEIPSNVIEILSNFVESRNPTATFVRTRDNVVFRFFLIFLIDTLSNRGGLTDLLFGAESRCKSSWSKPLSAFLGTWRLCR